MYTKAFEQVFSKTLVCDRLESAGNAMRRYQLNVITMDGDQVDRKGSFTGGYHDAKRSRLEAAEKVKRFSAQVETEGRRQAEVKQTISQLNQSITKIEGELLIAEKRLQAAKSGRAPLEAEALELKEEGERLLSRLSKLENALATNESELRNMKTQGEAYESEKATTMTQTLSDEEVELLTSLTKQLETDKAALSKIARSKADVRNRFSSCLLSLTAMETARKSQI